MKECSMAKSLGSKGKNLARLVEEKACSKKFQQEEEQKRIPYLPKDCLTNILIRLPHSSLLRSMLVCKSWRSIITSLNFVHAHLHRSDTILIFQSWIRTPHIYYSSLTTRPPESPNSFSIEANYLQSQNIPILTQPNINHSEKSYVKFMEFSNGNCEERDYKISCLGMIRATCDGLILLDNRMKEGGLIVLNPVTRKLDPLPLGTLYPAHKESYGFALSKVSGVYNVVHLFRDELDFFHCEILSLGTRVWRPVYGPEPGLFGWLGHRPVFAIGSLHWVPLVDHSDYIVSLEMDSEKFHKVSLPTSCRTYDRILEMHGSLCFIAHEEMTQINIWMLEGLSGHAWKQTCSITMGCTFDMVPLLSLKMSGDVIFERDEDYSLYRYHFELKEMRRIEVQGKCPVPSNTYFTHVNSFISWRCHGEDAGFAVMEV
ncbi:F-box/LRR-repeat/kelch-repeat protein At1g09650-like isoform X2 [Rhodamnia argentea]|nr:F-box/LRR-repeat/kelch-repeat protein At1g09650-like isoform X2 [Rhodamnia argentea]XP_030521169.1 F-box/LRR-repeat/kelch-repeat protein At1g09650-like isoform X2 [Rhodamnia argentea]